jgi:predicted nucleic acid-binding protein
LIVVSDTSPILNLARIGRIELLPALYGKVIIPSEVDREVRDSGSDVPLFDRSTLPWLTVAAAKDRAQAQRLRQHLDAGEAEAIALAIEYRADVLLVDERRGRRTANAAGLAVTGLLGVAANAKRTGLIDSAKPVLDELIQLARFWIGADLYRAVLTELGEQQDSA